MADQQITFLIKTIYDGKGNELTRQDLRRLVQEANAGSKEAADALDRWRSAYGRLGAAAQQAQAQMGTNTGSGLAVPVSQFNAGNRAAALAALRAKQGTPPVIPTPPPLPEQEEASGGGGSLLGGLGRFTQLATAAGLAYTAINKAKQITQEWFESIDRVVKRALDFSLIGTTVESYTSRTRQAVIHNKELAQTYSQIKENVLTVAREISHLTELQELQVTTANRVSDAQMAQELAANALRNRFSPIARIEEETRIKLAALTRQADMEKAMDQIREESFKKESERAKLREDMYKSHAEASTENIKTLQREAQTQQNNADDVKATAADKVKAMKEELAILQRLSSGKSGPEDLASYNRLRMTANPALNDGTEASGKVLSEILKSKLSHGLIGDVAGAAVAREKELSDPKEGLIAGANRAAQDAQDNANNAASKAKLEEQKRDFANQKVMENESEAQRADDDAKQQAEANLLRDTNRVRALEADRRAAEDSGKLQKFRSIPSANIDPTHGSTSVDPQMDEQTGVLKQILERLS